MNIQIGNLCWTLTAACPQLVGLVSCSPSWIPQADDAATTNDEHEPDLYRDEDLYTDHLLVEDPIVRPPNTTSRLGNTCFGRGG